MHIVLMILFVLFCKVCWHVGRDRKYRELREQERESEPVKAAVPVASPPAATGERYKACPRCGIYAVLSAAFCVQCGHRYRTKFD
jgi:hypothetical protein